MKYFYNTKTLEKNKDLLEKFQSLYENGFRDINERENFEVILNRVKGDKKANEPHSIIILRTDKNDSEVTGGLVVDWYEKSKCIHLIYLIIDDIHRRKGYATQLINEGIFWIKEWIRREKKIEIKNVFFESNIPWKTKEENDNFDREHRLKIFSKLGAGWIDIPYVQPALDITKEKVDNLFLLSFKQFNAEGNRIRAIDVIDFLHDLYQSLNEKKPHLDDAFKKMQVELENNKDNEEYIYLEPIPFKKEMIVYGIEKPSYHFNNASVTIHFIENDNNQDERVNCNYFSSFERDLINFQNQKNIPLKSILLYSNIEADLILPSEYKYTSEGTTHKIISNRTSLKVLISISYTKVFISNLRVWHLTLKPFGDDSYFTEFDLIKLANLFGSTQEESNVKNRIKFKIKKTNSVNIETIEIRDDSCIINNEKVLRCLKTGIIQIDTLKFEQISNDDINKFYEIFKKQERKKLDDPINSFSQAICGIILGIFHFERMDYEEIFDTIHTIMSDETSFMTLCRGTLFKIACDDELLKTVEKNILVNPYLLLPSTVLANNEYILSGAKEKLDSILKCSPESKLKTLESIQKTVNSTINSFVLTEIFQYPSEQKIIESGNIQRSLTNILNYITKRLEELSKKIEHKRANNSIISDALLNSILGLIAMFQLNSTFFDTVKLPYKGFLIYSVEIILAMTLFFIVRAKKLNSLIETKTPLDM